MCTKVGNMCISDEVRLHLWCGSLNVTLVGLVAKTDIPDEICFATALDSLLVRSLVESEVFITFGALSHPSPSLSLKRSVTLITYPMCASLDFYAK